MKIWLLSSFQFLFWSQCKWNDLQTPTLSLMWPAEPKKLNTPGFHHWRTLLRLSWNENFFIVENSYKKFLNWKFETRKRKQLQISNYNIEYYKNKEKQILQNFFALLNFHSIFGTNFRKSRLIVEQLAFLPSTISK